MRLLATHPHAGTWFGLPVRSSQHPTTNRLDRAVGAIGKAVTLEQAQDIE